MLCCVYVYFDYVVIGSRYFFFFKQKTAYEMRISDWSSDVCSSDLLALADAFGEFDEDLAAVVKSVKRPPGCTISIDRVTEIDVCEVDASGNRARRLGISILLSQRDELVLRILPGNGRHIGPFGRPKLHVVRAQIRVDHEIGHEVGARGLHQNMDLQRRARATLGVTDDPANGVAGRNGARAY